MRWTRGVAAVVVGALVGTTGVVGGVMLASAPPAAVYRDCVDWNRVGRWTDRKVLLTIKELKFPGTLSNEKLTQRELENLVYEVMAKTGVGNDQLCEWNKAVEKMQQHQKFNEAAFKKIMENIFDITGAVPGVGDIATVIQFIYNLVSGNGAGIAGDFAEGRFGAAGDGYAGNSGVSTSISLIKAMNVLASEWQAQQAKYRDIANGLNAARGLAKFYSDVDREVRDFVEKHKDKNRLQFIDAKATATFTFAMLEPKTEIWTLNSTLKYTGRGNTNPNLKDGHFEGTYSGDYSIDVTLEIDTIPSEWRDLLWRNYSRSGRSYQSFDLTSSVPSNWSRSLTGQATAIVRVDGSVQRADFAVSGDQRDQSPIPTSISGYFFDDDDACYHNLTYTFSPSGDDVTLSMEKDYIDCISGDIGFRNLAPAVGTVRPFNAWERSNSLTPATIRLVR